jgi:putative PIN family toxin of toxin-antitoxin system
MRRQLQVVVDTNVFAAALRSQRGASFRLLTMLGPNSRFQANVSVPLVVEYEAIALRQMETTGLTTSEVGAIVDYVCSVANHVTIHFLWRPFLRDPKDDMVLEAAVEARADAIVTFNERDFRGVEIQFGIAVVTPGHLLRQLGEPE